MQRDGELNEKIITEIISIHNSLSEDEFNKNIKAFFDKWQAEQVLEQFLRYFKKEWIVKNEGWYVGYFLEVIRDMNAQKAFHTKITSRESFKNRIDDALFLGILLLKYFI